MHTWTLKKVILIENRRRKNSVKLVTYVSEESETRREWNERERERESENELCAERMFTQRAIFSKPCGLVHVSHTFYHLANIFTLFFFYSIPFEDDVLKKLFNHDSLRYWRVHERTSFFPSSNEELYNTTCLEEKLKSHHPRCVWVCLWSLPTDSFWKL